MDNLNRTPATNQPLHFPLDTNLNPTPTLHRNQGQVVAEHLRLADSANKFSIKVVN